MREADKLVKTEQHNAQEKIVIKLFFFTRRNRLSQLKTKFNKTEAVMKRKATTSSESKRAKAEPSNFKSFQIDLKTIKKQTSSFKPPKGDKASKDEDLIRVVPWKPEGVTPDLPEFDIRRTYPVYRASVTSRIRMDKFSLFLDFNISAKWKSEIRDRLILNEEKRIYMVLKSDLTAFNLHLENLAKEQSKQSKLNFENRAWRKEVTSNDKTWKAYEDKRNALEKISDSWYFNDNVDSDDEDHVLENATDDIRDTAREVFAKGSAWKTKFATDEEQKEFLDKLEAGILPWRADDNNYYGADYSVRIYSPMIAGNFIDTWLTHHHRARSSWVESMRAIVCSKGSLKDSQETTQIEAIRKKGNMDVNGTFVHSFYDDRSRSHKGKANKVSKWRKHLFGDMKISDGRFALFLCAAAGMMSIFDSESGSKVKFDKSSEVGGVYKLLKKNYQHSTDSDVEEDVKSEEDDNSKRHYDSGDDGYGWGYGSDSEEEYNIGLTGSYRPMWGW
jgi:hypothetical protein